LGNPARDPLWGWTGPARGLLIIVAALGACALLRASWSSRGASSPLPRLVVDPNTARPEVLCALPRLGPVLAGRIVAARAEAPFRSLDELDTRVRGIGPATLRALRPALHIGRDEPAAARPPEPSDPPPGRDAP
jgi:competence protein ComEA